MTQTAHITQLPSSVQAAGKLQPPHMRHFCPLCLTLPKLQAGRAVAVHPWLLAGYKAGHVWKEDEMARDRASWAAEASGRPQGAGGGQAGGSGWSGGRAAAGGSSRRSGSGTSALGSGTGCLGDPGKGVISSVVTARFKIWKPLHVLP